METHNDSRRHERGKASSPITYEKQSYFLRSTTSVLKEIIGGGGATLVYDSLTQDNTPHTAASLLQRDYYPNHYHQQQRKEHVRIEQTAQSLKTNNSKSLLTLTGRQLQLNFPYNTKSAITKNRNNSVSLLLISFNHTIHISKLINHILKTKTLLVFHKNDNRY